MPIPVSFDAVRGEHWVDSVAHGRPLGGVFGVDELLALAGACLFAARTQRQTLEGRVAEASLPAECRGLASDFEAELHAAIDVYAGLAEALYDMKYEDCYEPQVRAVVCSVEGRSRVVPLQGYRPQAGDGPHAGPMDL